MKHKKLIAFLSGITVVILVVLSIVSDAAIKPTPISQCNIEGQEKSYFFANSWGGFDGPDIIGIDTLDNIYVAAEESSLIVKYDSAGNFIKSWGGAGSIPGEFQGAIHGITVDQLGYVYVTDRAGKIHRFDLDGNFIDKWGVVGSNPNLGQFALPSFVAVDLSDGNILVKSKQGIQKFTPEGVFLKYYENIPSSVYSIASDVFGNLYTYRGNKIKKYNPEGFLVEEWDAVTSLLSDANGISIDKYGNIYVADRSRIHKYDSSGNFLTYITGNFNAHISRVDSKSCLYVGDLGGDEVEKYCPSICARVTVVKDVEPSPDPKDFTFSIGSYLGESYKSYGQTILDDDNDPGFNNIFTFLVPPSNSSSSILYRLTEDKIPPGSDTGYSLLSLKCSDPTNDTTTYVLNDGFSYGRADIRISNSEEVVCTFKNSAPDANAPGKIIITKEYIAVTETNNINYGEHKYEFDFSTNFSQPFSLEGIENGNNIKEFTVPPNVSKNSFYTVSEFKDGNGIKLTDIICHDPSGDSQGKVLTRTANIKVSPGETVYCKFINADIVY